MTSATGIQHLKSDPQIINKQGQQHPCKRVTSNQRDNPTMISRKCHVQIGFKNFDRAGTLPLCKV